MPGYQEMNSPGAMPPAAMPPADQGAMPPADPGAMPPADQGAMPEDVMAAQEEQRQAQIEAIAASAPMPEKPYTPKAIQRMVDDMNGFISSIDESVPAVEFLAPEGGGKIDSPLPAEVFVPFVVTMAFVDQLGEYEKYVMKPEEMVSDTALKKAGANFKRMSKDKSLIEDMQAAAGGAPMDDEPMPEDEMGAEEMATGRAPDEDFDEDDEAIMRGM